MNPRTTDPAHQKTSFAYSRRAHRTEDQPISFLMGQAIANPQLISLAAGLVDYSTLPTAPVDRLLRKIFEDPNRAQAMLQYGTTEGFEELRALLYQHMAQLDGMTTDSYPGAAEDVVVSTGSQQLLHMLTEILVDPGDIVITCWPTYFVYTGALATFGAAVRSVDMDSDGMVPEALEALLGKLKASGELSRVKIVYTVPYHQNPTGITLSEDRRRQIFDITREYSSDHRILILEDAAYRELTYEGDLGRSIKALDKDNEYVALLQTFSKPFSPGLKTGYGLLPRDLIEPVLLNKGGRDFGSANITQHLLAEALKTGVYSDHVELLRKAYTLKRDAMLEALEEHLGALRPGEIHWTRPTGGLYVWLTLPESIDTGREGPLFKHAINEGVLFVPGEYCYPADPARTIPRNTIRLSFGVPTVEKIRDGIANLARAIQKVL